MPPAGRPAGVGANAGLPQIFSQLPLGTAGFDDALDFLQADKDEDFVRASAFLPWHPVPSAANAAITTEVAAPKDLITAAACLGGRLASSAATQIGWASANPLTSRITVGEINKQAAALKSFGLLTTTFTDSLIYRTSLVEVLSKQPNLSTLEMDGTRTPLKSLHSLTLLELLAALRVVAEVVEALAAEAQLHRPPPHHQIQDQRSFDGSRSHGSRTWWTAVQLCHWRSSCGFGHSSPVAAWTQRGATRAALCAQALKSFKAAPSASRRSPNPPMRAWGGL